MLLRTKGNSNSAKDIRCCCVCRESTFHLNFWLLLENYFLIRLIIYFITILKLFSMLMFFSNMDEFFSREPNIILSNLNIKYHTKESYERKRKPPYFSTFKRPEKVTNLTEQVLSDSRHLNSKQINFRCYILS